MKTTHANTFTAFDGTKLLYRGVLSDVVLKIKERLAGAQQSTILIFSDDTGKAIDFNFQGTKQDVVKRLEVFTTNEEISPSAGPGRPKLGVISREVSLLPRHWEWLATQPGGASAKLRLLVEEARKKSSSEANFKTVQERAYRVLSVLAGDLAGYEEALRALYKRDQKAFQSHMKSWPKDLQRYFSEISKPVFEEK